MISRRILPVPAAFAVAILAAACGAGSADRLETRTFRLESLTPAVTVSLLEPYILSEGGTIQAAKGDVPAITVRERPAVLDRIEATLVEFDRMSAPAVALHFQIIEAVPSDTTDPRIADVDAALRELFRFKGYRLVGEALIHGRKFATFDQQVAGGLALRGKVWEIRRSDDGNGYVDIDIRLYQYDNEPFLGTQILVPTGQTFVIGNGIPPFNYRTLILVVRPEIRH